MWGGWGCGSGGGGGGRNGVGGYFGTGQSMLDRELATRTSLDISLRLKSNDNEPRDILKSPGTIDIEMQNCKKYSDAHR